MFLSGNTQDLKINTFKIQTLIKYKSPKLKKKKNWLKWSSVIWGKN